MEPPTSTIKYTVWIGTFPVIDCTANQLTIDLGKNVTITMHLASPTTAKIGSKIPLYAEIPLDADARLAYIFSGSKTPSDR